MRARTAGAFILGFAGGVLCLGVGLWATGSLRIPGAPMLLPWQKPMPQPQARVVDVNELLAEARTPPPSPIGQFPVEPPPPIVPPPFNIPAAKAGPPVANALPPAPPAMGPPVMGPPVMGPPVMGPPAVAPSKTGGAERMEPPPPIGTPLTSLPRLESPIAGIELKKLADTFADPRDGRKHEALDIMAPKGTPVKAVAAGNVVKLFSSKQGGITVYQFDNTGTYCFYYAHLDRYAPGLREGTLLRPGDVLGYVGSTGDASPQAPHLHFAVYKLGPDKKWWDGTPINPLPLLQ